MAAVTLDAAIIGGGVTGAAMAYELSRYQLSVAVLEKENDVASGTTKANSGIIHAGYDPSPGTLMARLSAQSVPLAKALCEKLDVPHRQCGSLVVAFSREELPILRRLYRQGLQNGVPAMELLDGDQARELEPNLSGEALGALLAPTAMIVSPWEYALALMETAARNGAALHLESGVTGVSRAEDGWRIQTERGDFFARYVINAAGVHADAVHNMAAPPSFRIVPDRGEYYLLDKSERDRVSRVIFQCPTAAGKGTLVAPTVHGNLIVGPGNERIGDGEDVATTAEGLARIASRAKKSVPSIDFRANIRNFSGVRAAADTGDFIVGRAAPGFIDIAGIKSPGLSLAPAIAELAVELLREEGLPLRLKDSFIDTRRRVRLAELPPEEKAALAEKDPAWGRVVCRCETVTEGEILDALRTPIPPRSVDAVKRRCGAGLGRCQGGFCAPRILRLLSEHLGADPTEIMQDRAGTYILTGETKTGGPPAEAQHVV